MRWSALSLILLITAAPASAQTAPAAATVEGLFNAMRAQDTTAMRAAFHPDARLLGTGSRVQFIPISAWLNGIARATAKPDERLYDIESRVDGPLATVWTRYDFYLGDAFSHCGYDAFQLVLIGGAWKILQTADTQRRGQAACAPDPAETKPTSADTAAVVAAVQRLFDAMRTRDTVAIRAAFIPQGALAAIRENADSVRLQTLDAFTASIGRSTSELHERMVKPEVRISDGLATVWTWYDFHVGERFTHCGVDAVQLARTAEGWKIAHITYTTRSSPCTEPAK